MTLILGALGGGATAWYELLSQQMRQKFVFNSCSSNRHPGCDMLNLIFLTIFNSQNISHLFPEFMMTRLPGLFAESGRKNPEVFSPLVSAKSSKAAAAYQPHIKRYNYWAQGLQSSMTWTAVKCTSGPGRAKTGPNQQTCYNHPHLPLFPIISQVQTQPPTSVTLSPPTLPEILWEEGLVGEFSVHSIFAVYVTHLTWHIYFSEHHSTPLRFKLKIQSNPNHNQTFDLKNWWYLSIIKLYL